MSFTSPSCTVSITIFAHTGKTGNEIGGEFVSCTLPPEVQKLMCEKGGAQVRVKTVRATVAFPLPTAFDQ